jgi:uncharacterized protein
MLLVSARKYMSKYLFVFLLVVLMQVLDNCAIAQSQDIDWSNVKVMFPDSGVAALASAAGNADEHRVKDLISNGIDVNATGIHGVTPLIWNVQQKSLRGINILLNNGADPNKIMDGGATVIWLAAGSKSPEILRSLLEHGGDPNVRVDNKNCLMIALEAGRIDNIKILLYYHADINDHDDIDGTVATSALAEGRYQELVFILDNGYSYHLEYLARGLKYSRISKFSPVYTYKKQVINILRRKGVTIDPSYY